MIDYRLAEFRHVVPDHVFSSIPFASAEGQALLAQVRQQPTLVLPDERGDGEGWRCVCGNRPIEDGFLPCTWVGDEVEPTPTAWPDPLYRCERCGRIIDAPTRSVVSLAAAA